VLDVHLIGIELGVQVYPTCHDPKCAARHERDIVVVVCIAIGPTRLSLVRRSEPIEMAWEAFADPVLGATPPSVEVLWEVLLVGLVSTIGVAGIAVAIREVVANRWVRRTLVIHLPLPTRVEGKAAWRKGVPDQIE